MASKSRATALLGDLTRDLLSNPEKIVHVVKEFPEKVKENGGRIPFLTDITAVYYAVKDPKTPFKVKATLAGALAYFILPTDLIPDFVAVFGFTDDLGVLLLVMRRLGAYITDEHYELARRRLQGEEKSSD